MVTLVRARRLKGDRSKGTMRLRAHLAELRRRLFISFIALLVAAAAAFALTDPIIHFLASRSATSQRSKVTLLPL